MLDAPPPSVWTPERENGQKVTASTRVARDMGSITPLKHHAVNFIDTLSDDEEQEGGEGGGSEN